MSDRSHWQLNASLLMTAVAAVAALTAPPAGAQLHRYAGTRLSMACLYEIEAYGPDASHLPSIVEAAFDEVDRIDRLMSHYKADSPLSRLNREAASGPVAVDPELFDFLDTSLRFSRESDGAFDITVGPLMKAWGFFKGEGRMPSNAVLSEARRHVGRTKVRLDREHRTIRFTEPGVELDLGGIAKGYAVDRAARVLLDRGVTAALISAGGSTIYALGAPPGRQAWEVAVQHPLETGRTALMMPLRDRALSVAGSSEKSFEVRGRRYSHIMNPRSGRPVQGVLGVVVVAATGTAGDALDDAFFVLGPSLGSRYLTRLDAAAVYFFLPSPGGYWIKVVGTPITAGRPSGR